MDNRPIKESYIIKNDIFNKYKDEVEKRYGKKAGREILKSIVEKDLEPVAVSMLAKSTIEEPTRTFYDLFTGSYFESTLSNVLHAELIFNKYYVQGYPLTTVRLLHSLFGLPNKEKTFYDKYGWDSGYDSEFDQLQLIEFKHDIVMLDDGLEIVTISYKPYILRE